MQNVCHVFTEQAAFNLEYFPLKVGTSQGKLELTSNDLGLYVYDVELKAVPSAPEKALNFQACLGSSQTLSAKFVSYAKHKTDYTCKVCTPLMHRQLLVVKFIHVSIVVLQTGQQFKCFYDFLSKEPG